MPFDGTDFRAPEPVRPEFSQSSTAAGLRLWLRTRFCWTSEDEGIFVGSPWSWRHRIAVAQVLEEARRLIEDPKNWLKGSCRWFGGRRCMAGAVRVAAGRHEDITVGWSTHAVLIEIARAHGFTSVETMNDRSSHDEALEAFDEAVALVRSLE